MFLIVRKTRFCLCETCTKIAKKNKGKIVDEKDIAKYLKSGKLDVEASNLETLQVK
jgi:hypothetical protein